MAENRRFVVVVLDDVNRNSQDLTADLNLQIDVIAPAAELHFINAIAVDVAPPPLNFQQATVQPAPRPRVLFVFRQYDDSRGGRR